MCAGLCPTYWTTFGIAQRNGNGRCPMHEWDHPPNFLSFWLPLPPPPQGPMGTTGRGGTSADIVRTQIIFGVDPCTRCWDIDQKPPKCKKIPIDSIVTEISFASFSARRGPPTPKRGEYTSGTRVRQHANFCVNRPAGCREIVDRTNKKTKKHSKTNTSPFAILANGG